MWDADDDNIDTHTTAPHLSKSSGFTFDDAFSEDDGIIDATLEFNPAAIRAALARTLAAGGSESAERRNGVGDGGGSTDAGVSDLNSHHDRNESVKVEDPDASVSTLDINAPPVRAPGRAPDEWSRSTSYSHGYEYRQDSRDSTSGVESSASFSRISLGDSVHDFESVEVSLEPSEVVVEEAQRGLFRAVHIDISQGGKPRVEEFAAVLPEPSNLHPSDGDEARTPSPKPLLSPSLPPPSNDIHNTHISPSTPTPTSGAFQSQSRHVPEPPLQTVHHASAEDNHTRDEIILPLSPLGDSSPGATSESIPIPSSTTSPSNSSQPGSSRHGGHRHSRSVGPSTLDKVISKTRPNFLPPKPKTEDLKHMADWEAMMKQSRVVGEFHFYPSVRLPCWFFPSFGRIQAY